MITPPLQHTPPTPEGYWLAGWRYIRGVLCLLVLLQMEGGGEKKQAPDLATAKHVCHTIARQTNAMTEQDAAEKVGGVQRNATHYVWDAHDWLSFFSSLFFLPVPAPPPPT